MVFHLQLTGYVGSSTFSARTVRSVLAQYPGKHVDILIDSFGGSLPEGLSICGAIRDHGDVTVHFRGMNASAATLASMGAKKISMAQESMYLVHKVSMEFFDWASRNSDQLDDFIKALQSAKDDLDTMDRNIAELYASRCKRPVKDLLDLMKKECWLTAQQALEWGFIDELVADDRQQDAKKGKPSISKAQANAFQTLGLPLPPVDIEPESTTIVNRIIEGLKSIFNPDKMETSTQPTTGSQQPVTNNQQTVPQNSGQPANPDCGANEVNAPANSATDNPLQAEIDRLKAENEELRRRTPAASTAQIVNGGAQQPVQNKEETAFSRYCKVSASARTLFDSVP